MTPPTLSRLLDRVTPDLYRRAVRKAFEAGREVEGKRLNKAVDYLIGYIGDDKEAEMAKNRWEALKEKAPTTKKISSKLVVHHSGKRHPLGAECEFCEEITRKQLHEKL